MKILIIDNYDSFTFNLVQLVGEFVPELFVRRNDKITLDEIDQLKPDKILISPGPGKPEDSNMSLTILKELGKSIPILGVCLGHQAIGIAYGGVVTHAPYLMHGKSSKIIHDGKTIYHGIEQNFVAGRYHSLIIEKSSLPDSLEISSETEDGIIMGVRHKTLPVEGIQFHPESILTNVGSSLIKNWIQQ